MSVALLGALLAALAVLLALGPPRRRLPSDVGRPASRPLTDGASGRRATLVAVVVVAGVAATFDGGALVLALVGLGWVMAVGSAWQRRRRERVRRDRASKVVELGESMVGELRAGQPPLAALRRAAEVWPEVSPVVAAAELGADVPTSLRALARSPGAGGLAELAAAWQVSERSGAALTTALSQVVESARARRQAVHLVAGELSSARATARLVALLPVGTLAMASSIGGDPWAFVLSDPIGLACLASGSVLVVAGLAWIDRIAGSVLRP